ncbi:MAG TPA: DUF429 domain-containing protein, partial [Acidimicrobiales bacterium]|nr:DUF429 domain-containing protein [Acidimicrobiales bacterium]
MGIVLAPGGAVHGVAGGDVGTVVEEAAAVAGPPVAVGVDMPLHLSPAGWRPCDEAVRGFLGARRSSVFPVPPAPALVVDDYGAACEVSRRLAGRAFSRQLWMLRPKIAELAAWWAAAGGPASVREVHPETSFAVMAGAPLTAPKRSWEGAAVRRAALATRGVVVPGDLGEAGRVA